jgi:hypothetical protein
MKLLAILLTAIGVEVTIPKYLTKENNFSRSEIRFINNVLRINGKQQAEVFRLKNGKIAVNYPDQRIVLGKDGFIHDLEILEDGEWIDLGPEY